MHMGSNLGNIGGCLIMLIIFAIIGDLLQLRGVESSLVKG